MAWELASGAGKETGLAALFKGASLIGRSGEAVSVFSALQNKTVLLYFAASWAEPCKSFNVVLSKFYELVRETDDSIAIIFVSNDKSKEEQLAFFSEGGMHADFLMVEWTYDLQDIMDGFNVEKIPQLVVVNQEGKAVVEDARNEIYDLFSDEQGRQFELAASKAAVAKKWAAWRRLAGDWRASEGHTLGGSSSSAGPAPPAGGSGFGGGAPAPRTGLADLQPPSTASAQANREALRAARLAALEKQMGAGGVAAGAFPTEASGASSSSSWVAPPPPQQVLAPAAASSSSSGPRIATISSGPAAAHGGTSSSTGSGTFAAGASGAPSGGTAYTLAGGRVELPPPPGPGFDGGAGSALDIASDMASDGAESLDVGHDDLMEEEAAATRVESLTMLVSMGFTQEQAEQALEVTHGDVDTAVALLVGDS